jgi:hypothetical protein
MKNISDFMDEDGFIGHKWIGGTQRLEFGDGSQRFGMNDLMEFSIHSFEMSAPIVAGFYERHWMITQGEEPVRHPVQIPHPGVESRPIWWSDSGTMSRDGWLPQVAMFHAIGDLERLKEMASQLKSRFFFLWNTKEIWSTEFKVIPIPDWSGLNLIGLLYRLQLPRWAREIADSWLILEALARVLSSFVAPGHTSADLTFFTSMKTREIQSPTITFWIAMWIYFSGHNRSPEWCFEDYFDDENSPPLDIVLKRASTQTRSRLWNIRSSSNGPF